MNISLTEVCAYFLSDYLKSRDLFTKDFPTDTERFDAILDEFKQKEAPGGTRKGKRNANIPSWAEDLGT